MFINNREDISMYKTLSLIMALSLFLTSCCTIARDPTTKIMVTAQQRDTEIFIDGYACGTAPLWVDLDKTCDHTIIASKPGYQGQHIRLKSQHTMGAAFNLITPIAGAAVGTGIGLMMYGSGGYILPYCIGGTLLGGAIGLGLGAVGAATDLCTRSDCDLDRKTVHFNLNQAH
jgi:hypothetical protein